MAYNMGLGLSSKIGPIYQLALPLLMLLIGFGWVKRKAGQQAAEPGAASPQGEQEGPSPS